MTDAVINTPGSSLVLPLVQLHRDEMIKLLSSATLRFRGRSHHRTDAVPAMRYCANLQVRSLILPKKKKKPTKLYAECIFHGGGGNTLRGDQMNEIDNTKRITFQRHQFQATLNGRH